MLWHVDKRAKMMSLALRHMYTGSPQIIPKITLGRSIRSLKGTAIRTPSPGFNWFWLVPGYRRFSRLHLKEGNPISDPDWRGWHLNLSPMLQLHPNCKISWALSLNYIFNYRIANFSWPGRQNNWSTLNLSKRDTQKFSISLEMQRGWKPETNKDKKERKAKVLGPPPPSL